MVLIRSNVGPGRLLTTQMSELSIPHLRFSSDWDLLGPFQTGTRGDTAPFLEIHRNAESH